VGRRVPGYNFLLSCFVYLEFRSYDVDIQKSGKIYVYCQEVANSTEYVFSSSYIRSDSTSVRYEECGDIMILPMISCKGFCLFGRYCSCIPCDKLLVICCCVHRALWYKSDVVVSSLPFLHRNEYYHTESDLTYRTTVVLLMRCVQVMY